MSTTGAKFRLTVNSLKADIAPPLLRVKYASRVLGMTVY